MASNTVEGNSLEQLQSREQIALLDTIDKLRNQGVGDHNISLPQLIVCGDQSSGKSSVLEGLTRLKFPSQEGTCTTFATELILRKDASVVISCTLVPGKNRTPTERDELSKFQRCYATREDFDFPALIDDARHCMAFGIRSTDGVFFEDVLQIKYSGPDLPSLTIVDLPGIIQTPKKEPNGPATVRKLVSRYMADEKSIILAVVHAKTDRETQSVLRYVQKHDPSRSRTLGIITKPDKIEVGSADEAAFLKLARNESIVFDLGWHVVRNRGHGERDYTDAERDESEHQFFNTGVWASLPRENVGIETLRMKLSRVLLQHIRKELPSLTAAIQNSITTTEADLKELGNPRDDPQQQRNFLMEKAGRFQTLTLDALRGLYSDPFFKLASADSIPPTRLRTEIQNLNLAFAYTMYKKGHQFQISGDSSLISNNSLESFWTSAVENYDEFQEPIEIERKKFLAEYIETQVRLSRPSGLPSLVNTWVIGEVFRQQSEAWETIAQKHLNSIYDAVHAYLHESLSSTMDVNTYSALMRELIEPELEERQKRLDEKLRELLVPFQSREPIIYDPAFNQDLYQLRMKRLLRGQQSSGNGNSPRKSFSSSLLLTDVDDFTSCEILDLMDTYYKKSISVFISNVTVLAIENCLITDLPSLLNPDIVLNMSEETLAAIAAESDEIQEKRADWTRKLEDLRAGKRILDSQARMSGKNIYSSPRPQRRSTPSNPEAPRRPQTPVPIHVSSEDEVDKLTSSSNRVNVTPTTATKTSGRNEFIQKGAPLTPHKSPKMAPDQKAGGNWRKKLTSSFESAEWED